MHCPYCTFSDSKVTDSRVVENGIRRRRECQRCGLRFTTYERIQATALMVSKHDGRREEFNREKLIVGIRKACTKRPISSRTIEKMVEDVEAELQHLGQVDVPTSILGSMVMERLMKLDRVAYIRFASIYQDFQQIESFEQAVQDLREENTQLPLMDVPPGEPGRKRRRSSNGQARQRGRISRSNGESNIQESTGEPEGDNVVKQ
ncbi:MAG: transcriptional regulator NrdR [Chloroflexi bacterium]|nr:transcriptional regulator NrdR [Chloroflexota bacterium]HIM49081.1 transcriptional repressor NrdR [Dehalococcoidia bacterium]|tara:strand:+ start:1821 stop:2435 length:615 start_codon:yes stop_codon:yes gene_type:complete